jgi:hypothetical protein
MSEQSVPFASLAEAAQSTPSFACSDFDGVCDRCSSARFVYKPESVMRLCEVCLWQALVRVADDPDSDEDEFELAGEFAPPVCEQCEGSGYFGRSGVPCGECNPWATRYLAGAG